MLNNSEEIRIIARARQKNVRDPNRSREHFVRIFADFFGNYDFSATRWLDLGPGQYDFAEMVRDKQGMVDNIDRDDAVLELGRYKGFVAVEGDLLELEHIRPEHAPYDGVFCKFSINAFWFHDDLQKLARYASWIAGLIKDDAAGWVAPWNGVPADVELSAAETARLLALQRDSFSEQGFQVTELSPEQARYYGVHGRVANNVVFTRNL